MSFAIMRCKKLKSVACVAASLSHCFRDRETTNADSSKTVLNAHYRAESASEGMQKLMSLLPQKRRKDAVLTVEYLMTASPDWWKNASSEQQDVFFKNSYAWLAKKYGADRIVVASVHRDETSPHLSAFVVPLTRDGRLSAKEFIGDRAQMSIDQTTYAEAVKELGLERGVKGSRAKHQTVKAFYAALEKGTQTVPQLTPEDVQAKSRRKWLLFRSRESQKAVLERLNAKLKAEVAPIAQIAATARSEYSRAGQMHETALRNGKQLAALKNALRGLGKDDIASLVGHINELQSKRSAMQQQKTATQTPRGRGVER